MNQAIFHFILLPDGVIYLHAVRTYCALVSGPVYETATAKDKNHFQIVLKIISQKYNAHW